MYASPEQTKQDRYQGTLEAAEDKEVGTCVGPTWVCLQTTHSTTSMVITSLPSNTVI